MKWPAAGPIAASSPSEPPRHGQVKKNETKQNWIHLELATKRDDRQRALDQVPTVKSLNDRHLFSLVGFVDRMARILYRDCRNDSFE